MNTTQLSAVLFAVLCVVGHVCAAPAPSTSDLSAKDHTNMHEVEERAVDSVEIVYSIDIYNQVREDVRVSGA